MRQVLMQQLIEWRDAGFLPEGEIHSRAGDDAPWMLAQDQSRYPIERVVAMADVASSLNPDSTPRLLDGLKDPDSAVRYWAALGLLMRGQAGVQASRAVLQSALADESPTVRVTAAEALGLFGNAEDLTRSRSLLVDHSDLTRHDTFTVMLALNALQSLDPEKTSPAKDRIAELPEKVDAMPPRADGYVARLLEKLREDLGLE